MSDAERDQRTLVTPEGIPLNLTLASVGERFGAFAFDAVVMVCSGLLLAWLVLLSLGGEDSGWFMAFFFVAWFILRNGYFIFFELTRGGRTPGKNRMNLRVIDARGGALRAEAVIVRNLTRDLEVFLPLQVLAAPEMIWTDAPGWAGAVASLWLLVFAGLPFFNRDHLRVGDLVGGTRVVRVPEMVLLDDVSTASAAAAFTFTADELVWYGEYELGVLEEVLRREGGTDPDTLRAVTRRICSRIGRNPREPLKWPERFLTAFYAAQRAALEQGMLFGRRLADKQAARSRASKPGS